MLEPQDPATVDLLAWVQKARTNPVLYRQRQLTEILLNAVAMTPGFRGNLFLKGGVLMALAYESPRNTGDVDFSATGDPEEMRKLITDALDPALRMAAVRTGHPDILCRVQRITLRPKPETFAGSTFPALELPPSNRTRGWLGLGTDELTG